LPKEDRKRRTDDTITFEIKEESRSERRKGFSRATTRKAAESLAVAAGVGSLIFASVVIHDSIGRTLELGSVGATVFLVFFGVTLTRIGLQNASPQVKMGGGSTLALVGLCLLLFVFLTAYNLMGVSPRLENLFWLSAMMIIAVFTARAGIPQIHRLDSSSREIWGSMYAFVGLGELVFCAWTVHTLVESTPRPANLAWLLIMISLSVFMMRQGSPLVAGRRGIGREAWEWSLIGVSIGVFGRLTVLLYDVQRGALEEIDLLWASVLAAMCLFLLVWGLKLKRK